MENKVVSPEVNQALADVAQHSVYLMGASFILGSLVTVMFLLVLDFMRRNKAVEE